MRWPHIVLIALIFLLPFPVGAEEFSDCEEDTVSCTCTPEDVTPLENQTVIGSVEDCQEYCTDVSGQEETVTGYSLQCTVDGEITTISQGGLDSIQDDFDDYYYEDPDLGVDIPGLEFSSAYRDGDRFVSNYLGEYVAAIYDWLLPAAALLAVVVLMIAGLQWMLARGNTSRIDKAKGRIRNAVTGVILLLGAYTLAYLIDPRLVTFEALETSLIAQQLDEDTGGEEGSVGTSPGVVAEDCLGAVENAKELGSCTMDGELASPTGAVFSCNYHLRNVDYDYTQVNALDYAAGFGGALYAPFDGTVKVVQGNGNRCGNQITLTGSGAQISICHMKDFLGPDGDSLQTGDTVKQGDSIGHIGGNCCSGESAPSDWSQASQCIKAGPTCSSPFVDEDCSCQPWEQSGNTSGPHVHISFHAGGDLLTCLDESNY